MLSLGQQPLKAVHLVSLKARSSFVHRLGCPILAVPKHSSVLLGFNLLLGTFKVVHCVDVNICGFINSQPKYMFATNTSCEQCISSDHLKIAGLKITIRQRLSWNIVGFLLAGDVLEWRSDSRTIEKPVPIGMLVGSGDARTDVPCGLSSSSLVACSIRPLGRRGEVGRRIQTRRISDRNDLRAPSGRAA